MKMHGILRRVCSLIHPSDHSTLFYSFIYPYLNYCGIVWAATYLSYLNKLLMIQKRFLKTIFHANRFATSAPLFRKYSLLSIDKLNDSQTGLFIFKFLNCKQDLPVTFHNFISFSSEIHTYPTRHSSRLYLPFCRASSHHSKIKFRGPKTWNTLKLTLRSISTQPAFKKQLKDYLISTI